MKTRIAGVALWIWIIGLAVIGSAVVAALPKIQEILKPAPLEIVKKELWKSTSRCEVRGQIYNPRKKPARNVTVSFLLRETQASGRFPPQKDQISAVIEYVPAEKTVDFTALSAIKISEYSFVEIDDGALSESSASNP